MSNLLRLFQSAKPVTRTQLQSSEGLEQGTAPEFEAGNYKHMLENLMDATGDNLDRWRTRMPQG